MNIKNNRIVSTMKELFNGLEFIELLIFGIISFSVLGYWISEKFEEKSIKEQYRRELLIMAPSTSKMKSKLIEAKNNPNDDIKFDDQYATLTIKNNNIQKNGKRIIYTMKKSGLLCEQLYNITEDNFKINNVKVYHYTTKEIQDHSVIKNTTETYIQKGNNRPDIIKYCQNNKNIEFDVIK